MNKKFFQMLFQDKKLNNIEENDNFILLGDIPFFGISGTICRIEEAPESYYKVIYNQDGSINPLKIPVPKKKTRNLEFVLNDYVNDLKKYLEVYSNRYNEYNSISKKTIFSDKEFYGLMVIIVLALIASVPFLFTSIWAGLVFGLMSIIALSVVWKIRKKDRKKIIGGVDFIAKYEELQRLFKDYQMGNNILERNKRKDLGVEEDKFKTEKDVFNKFKIFSRNKIREVA